MRKFFIALAVCMVGTSATAVDIFAGFERSMKSNTNLGFVGGSHSLGVVDVTAQVDYMPTQGDVDVVHLDVSTKFGESVEVSLANEFNNNFNFSESTLGAQYTLPLEIETYFGIERAMKSNSNMGFVGIKNSFKAVNFSIQADFILNQGKKGVDVLHLDFATSLNDQLEIYLNSEFDKNFGHSETTIGLQYSF